MFKGKSKLPFSSNWGKVLLSRLRVNPSLFLSADLSSFVPHKWTHLIDFLSTWITSIAVNMGRQIPLLPSQWGWRRMGVAAGGGQPDSMMGADPPSHHPCVPSHRTQQSCLRASTFFVEAEGGTMGLQGGFGTVELAHRT